MDIQGKDGNTYNIVGKQVYIVETRKSMLYATVFFLLCFIGLFMYDYVKDAMRVISGYGNILNGNSIQGGLKVMGYTEGNIKRGVGLVVLFILMIGSGYFSRRLRLLTQSEIPDDIKIKMKIK
jgi:hypothetical protein